MHICPPVPSFCLSAKGLNTPIGHPLRLFFSMGYGTNNIFVQTIGRYLLIRYKIRTHSLVASSSFKSSVYIYSFLFDLVLNIQFMNI
jgi:hypothetical protein